MSPPISDLASRNCFLNYFTCIITCMQHARLPYCDEVENNEDLDT